jgi:preprotein translocase subunit SecA
MGPIFHYLGLSVASIQHEASFLYDPTYQPEAEELKQIESQTEGLVMDVKHMRPITRKSAYQADITYGTNNEYGFDYLRDNMAVNANQLSQRELFFAIVDEVDSILIDEARTPLIISAPDTDPTDKYVQFARIVNQLTEHEHYTVDEKHKSAGLTDGGINKIEEILKVPNIYDTTKGVQTVHHLEQALRAKTLFKIDRDYVVKNGEIIIVDEFTGRMMYGRRYSEGLHQAIEAKEGVKIQQESRTLATITFQNLFRLYSFLSGMTGTAKTEEEEFFKIYQLQVETIPTHRQMVRQDFPDSVFKTETAKFEAIAREVKHRHEKGQPMLIGTVSIAKNELLAQVLKQHGLKFELLNAKNHEREAHIIAQAGRLGAITLATNIAGRGVDIFLGGNPVDEAEAEAVKQAGGLHIIGTERHESRRIDNQLRGRAGRQGDAGSSQFYVSMEDDLMRLFGGERMKSLMTTLGLPDDQPIEAKLVSRSIESAQKRIEGLNFDTRKHVLEFDDVLNHQRNTIYTKRKNFVANTPAQTAFNFAEEMLGLVKKELESLVQYHFTVTPENSIEELIKALSGFMPVTPELAEKIKTQQANSEAIGEIVNAEAQKIWQERVNTIGETEFFGALRYIALQAIDGLWMEHLDSMDHLRDSVRLRGYGQRDPLVEYKKEGHLMFKNLLAEIDKQIVYTIFRISLKASEEIKQTEVQSSKPVALGGEVGRNDPCPCGSGKKWKKCGMIGAKEHKTSSK